MEIEEQFSAELKVKFVAEPVNPLFNLGSLFRQIFFIVKNIVFHFFPFFIIISNPEGVYHNLPFMTNQCGFPPYPSISLSVNAQQFPWIWLGELPEYKVLLAALAKAKNRNL